MEYEIARDEDDEIETCDCCDCDVPTSLFDKPIHLLSEEGKRKAVSEPRKREDQFRYCEVCAATLISSVHGYPQQHYEDGHILRCMAQCTNLILEEIRSLKNGSR